ncbi:PAAR domain-containing protein [Entomomonas moraniae]|uniref:PAAR domain-containing protein n=1 Tax=Entomomonas moraniae TaxID=2213226 RepID=A0A3S9XCQ0_9GAMM|nr:PAAR domain-containing protein [Entomomonas moraniae]AZS50190.1 PAAR domain-containing protein [Entomomonas moraniae]
MVLKSVIRKGDKTSHGGTVTEGLDNHPIKGIGIACKSHKVTCPKCLGSYPIEEGVMNVTIEGLNPAVEGMKTKCGATLIASQREYQIEG